jgi:DUF2992 family protein
MTEVFTVYFDGQFWVGVLELHGPDGVRAARHIFGPEPTNPELLQFAGGGEFDRLARLALASPAVPSSQRALSWKRVLKNLDQPVGTAAQRAMKASVAARAVSGKVARRKRVEEEKEWRRALARAKAKAKHRGR